jgi:hypothetical protein
MWRSNIDDMGNEKFDPLSISFSRFMEQEEFTTTGDIIKHLLSSKENGTVIGISSTVLGRTMVLTGIRDLIFGDELLIVLMPFDTSGYMLPATKISVKDIRSVKPFKSKFENPFVAKLRDDQNSMLA